MKFILMKKFVIYLFSVLTAFSVCSCDCAEETGCDGNLANDPLYVKAIKTGYDYGGLSVSLLQRKLGVGYPRAAKIIDWLTDNGYITPNVIDKKHQMIMPLEEFEEKFGGES